MSSLAASSTCVVRAPEAPAAPPTRTDAAPTAPLASAPGPSARRAVPAALPRTEDARDLAASVASFLAAADGLEPRDGDAKGAFGAAGRAEDADGALGDPVARYEARDEREGRAEGGVVDLFGDCADRASVRAQLLGFYAATKQLAGSENGGEGAARASVTEMTLRVDTELELLRRQCFAERNARWDYATPDMFEFAPPVEPTWAPQPANYKLALLQRAQTSGSAAAVALHAAGAAVAPPTLDGFPVGDYARERPWPPREFAVKPLVKPKGRGGKRKATPAAVVAAAAQAPESIYPRMCVDCHTQTTPLWRKRAGKKSLSSAAAAAQGPGLASTAAGGALVANGAATQPHEAVDVCMRCFLRTERRDLFDRKKTDKARKEREKKERAAVEKKRLQQAKKHQKKQPKRPHDQGQKERGLSSGTATVGDPIDSASRADADVGETPREAKTVLKFTKDELDVALERSGAKKEKKRSHHDKKKKKKKKRKLEHVDDSDTDGVGTLMPSPPQMAGYEYADADVDVAHADAGGDGFLLEREAPKAQVATAQPVDDSDTGRNATRSSRKRDGKIKSPGGSSSKKRRGSADVASQPAAPPLPPQTAAPSSRPSRAKAAAAPVVALATPTNKRKRARTKKESNRERELRALGQYCPVCNETYEEDDDSSFVCCDSCEMWVHTACDPSLSPEAVTALANPDEKYICPLCAGR